jgi:hypothetical protein
MPISLLHPPDNGYVSGAVPTNWLLVLGGGKFDDITLFHFNEIPILRVIPTKFAQTGSWISHHSLISYETQTGRAIAGRPTSAEKPWSLGHSEIIWMNAREPTGPMVTEFSGDCSKDSKGALAAHLQIAKRNIMEWTEIAKFVTFDKTFLLCMSLRFSFHLRWCSLPFVMTERSRLIQFMETDINSDISLKISPRRKSISSTSMRAIPRSSLWEIRRGRHHLSAHSWARFDFKSRTSCSERSWAWYFMSFGGAVRRWHDEWNSWINADIGLPMGKRKHLNWMRWNDDSSGGSDSNRQ